MADSTGAPKLTTPAAESAREHSPKEEQPFSWRRIWAGAIILFVVYIGYGIFLLLRPNYEAAAHIGDAFGVISGLLNAVGLIAAVSAVALQRHELQETRKEVRITLETQERQAAEAKRSADAHEKSVEATRLLANVQALSALLANIGSIRNIAIVKINELYATPEQNRNHEQRQEIHHQESDLDALNNTARAYAEQLYILLRTEGGLQEGPATKITWRK